MLKRSELRSLAHDRLKDAQALLDAKRYDGAIYLCGYAVELALKARVCKTLKWTEFPETSGEFDKLGLKALKTHDFSTLLRFSGCEMRVKTKLLAEWSAVAKWQPELRYQRTGTCTPATAAMMLLSARAILKTL